MNVIVRNSGGGSKSIYVGQFDNTYILQSYYTNFIKFFYKTQRIFVFTKIHIGHMTTFAVCWLRHWSENIKPFFGKRENIKLEDT